MNNYYMWNIERNERKVSDVDNVIKSIRTRDKVKKISLKRQLVIIKETHHKKNKNQYKVLITYAKNF